MSAVKTFWTKLARQLIGEYSPYYIYLWTGAAAAQGIERKLGFDLRPIDESQLAAADGLMMEQVGYLGSESMGFGYFVDGQLAGVCFYWFGERYKRRGFWPLKQGEAKLVQIIVSPAARGQGVASALIQGSAQAMADAGFFRLYARIWHSNRPSMHAFEKSGWRRIAFVLEFNPFRTKKPLRVQRMYKSTRFPGARPGKLRCPERS